MIAPYGSEFLLIKMRGRYPSQMVKVVNAVKDSYLKNIVDVERRQTYVESNLLESKLREQQTNLDKMRQDSIKLENLYGLESPAKEAERLMLDQQLTSKNQEIMAKNSDIGTIEGQILMIELRDKQGYQAPQWLVDKLLEQDPQIQDFEKSLQQYKAALAQVEGAVKNKEHDPTVKMYRAQVNSLQSQLQSRKEELQPKVIEQLKMAGDGQAGTGGTSSLVELKGRKAAVVDAVAKLQEQYDQLAQTRVNLFKSSAELKRLNADIQEAQSFVNQLKAQEGSDRNQSPTSVARHVDGSGLAAGRHHTFPNYAGRLRRNCRPSCRSRRRGGRGISSTSFEHYDRRQHAHRLAGVGNGAELSGAFQCQRTERFGGASRHIGGIRR